MAVMSSARRAKSWQIADELATLVRVMEERESLSVRLRRLARAHGLISDEEAARFLQMSYRQYQRWLAGESEPRTSSLKGVAERYGVPITELVDAPAADPDQLSRIETALEQLDAKLSAVLLGLEAPGLEAQPQSEASPAPAAAPPRQQRR